MLVDAVEAACVNEIGRSPSVPALYLLCDVAVSVASRLDDPTECANAVAWTLLEVGAPATPTTRPIFEAVPHNRAGLWAWRLAEELACIDSELTALLSQVRFDPAGRLLDDPGPKVTAAVLARIGSATAGLLSRHADMATNMRPGGGLRVDAVIPAGAEVASI